MDQFAQDLANQSGLGAAVAPARIANDSNGLDPREVVDMRFFLTPQELDEATAVRAVTSNQPKNKAIMRAICGIGAVYAVLVPYMKGANWPFWWEHHRGSSIFWIYLLVMDIYVVCGQPGMKQLGRVLNRLNVERCIRVSHRGIEITHGRMHQQKSWSDFSFYQETPTIYLLQTHGALFWTLPKRAIPAGRGDQLEALLKAKLRQR